MCPCMPFAGLADPGGGNVPRELPPWLRPSNDGIAPQVRGALHPYIVSTDELERPVYEYIREVALPFSVAA